MNVSRFMTDEVMTNAYLAMGLLKTGFPGPGWLLLLLPQTARDSAQSCRQTRWRSPPRSMGARGELRRQARQPGRSYPRCRQTELVRRRRTSRGGSS